MALSPGTGSGEELLRSALNKAELEALETLKLQYFQNATRFLAKGEYDNALAEIKRVLLIDPAHRLAREYEARVTELQASRAQAQKAEPAPLKETPRVVPAPIEMVAPAPPHRTSRKTLLYIALAACLLLGTTGVLTLEKVNDEEPLAVATAAHVTPQVTPPAEQPAEKTIVEEPTPSIEPLVTVEPGRTHVDTEKSEPRPEPVRRDPPAVPSGRGSPTESERPPATPAVNNVEPPPAPLNNEAPAAQPEVKTMALAAPPVAEAVHESAPFVAVQEDPKVVHLEKPRLPDIVLQNHMSGSVTARVLIDRDGKPQEVQILSSTSSIFEQPVIDAITNSTFSPGMMGTGPVAAWVVIPFKFK